MYFLIWVKLVMELINDNLHFNVLNTIVFVALIVVIVLGLIGLKLEIFNKKEKSQKVIIMEWNNITDRHFLGYFSLFVLFAITFDLSKVSMVVVFVLILCMIGVVYVKNKLFYINPFLNILGFNFYKISYKIENDEQVLQTHIFYRGNLKENKFKTKILVLLIKPKWKIKRTKNKKIKQPKPKQIIGKKTKQLKNKKNYLTKKRKTKIVFNFCFPNKFVLQL